MFAILVGTGIAILAGFTGAVPPEACFAKFRWEDCGKPPVPVMYYWKPGSRCEVGMWRGCLPNLNMFKNEYECVSTCIFRVKAEAADFHQQNEIEEILGSSIEETTRKNDNTSSVTGEIPDIKPTEGPNDDQDGDNAIDSGTEVNNEDHSNNGSDTSDQPDNIGSTNDDIDIITSDRTGATNAANDDGSKNTDDSTTIGSAGPGSTTDANTKDDGNADVE